MDRYDDTEYLRVLELDDEAPNIHRVCRDPNAVAHLIESLIRETPTLIRKEVWALESGEDHASMSTGSENGFTDPEEASTGCLVSRSEPKTQISKSGVLFLTKTLMHQSFTTGSSREFEVVSGRRMLRDYLEVQVKDVSLGCSGDLMVTLEDIAATAIPYKSVLEFVNLELKFLVVREILPHKLLVTSGFPVCQEGLMNIERELKKSSSVVVFMVDDSRRALHIVETTSVLQTGLILKPPRTPVLSPVKPSCSNGSQGGQDYDVPSTVSQQTAVSFLELPLASAIRCLDRKFGLERVLDAFMDIYEQTESSSLSSHSGMEIPLPIQSSYSSQESSDQIQDNIECDFDPLNTPIFG